MNTLEILLRQLIAAVSGSLAEQGLATDGTTDSLVTAALIFAGAVMWSWFRKLEWNTNARQLDVITDSRVDMLRKLLGVLVSQGLAALSGYLATHGQTVDVNDPVALSVFGVNALGSRLGAHQRLAMIGARKSAALLVASLSLLSLAACSSFTKDDAIDYGARVAISAGEAAVALARVELGTRAQAWMDAKTSGDPAKEALARVAMDAAQRALDAAEKALAKEKARLDKQPLNVSPNPKPGTRNKTPVNEIDFPVGLLHSAAHGVQGDHPATRSVCRDETKRRDDPPNPKPETRNPKPGARIHIPKLGAAVAARLTR